MGSSGSARRLDWRRSQSTTAKVREDGVRIVVVGAGVIGLSVAWALQRAGARITLVDPDPGQGATRAAAGMIAPTAEAYHGEAELAALMVYAARAWPRFADDLAAAAGRDSGYRPTRTLVCATDAADRGALTDLHTLHQRFGLVSEPLTTRQARALEPLLSPTLAGAFLMPEDHEVDPRTLTASLLSVLPAPVPHPAVRVLHERDGDPTTPVTGVELADGARLDADAVVVANALSATELAGLPLDLGALLRPVHGDVLRLAPPEDWPDRVGGTVRALVGGFPVYVVPRADGGVVVGATSREAGRPRLSAGGVHQLLRDAIRGVPTLAEYSLVEAMARARPGTPDNGPLLGLLGPGLLLADGFHRHGVLLAPAAAAAATRLLLDAAVPELPGLAPFTPSRFTDHRTVDT